MNNAESLADFDPDAFAKELSELVLARTSLKETQGIKDEELEVLYNHGFLLYNNDKAEDAEIIFLMLADIDTKNPKYRFALGAARHVQKKYRQAISDYTEATIRDQENPIYLFHGSDCALNLDDPENAVDLLTVCIDLCADHKEHADLKKRAEQSMEKIKKEHHA